MSQPIIIIIPVPYPVQTPTPYRHPWEIPMPYINPSYPPVCPTPWPTHYYDPNDRRVTCGLPSHWINL
jgi:hypothetical protein